MDEQPLIFDAGKRKKKQIKQLKKGEGPIAAEVRAVVEQALAGSTDAREVVPVILVYREKTKAKARIPSMMNAMNAKKKMPLPMMPFAKMFGLG